MKNITERDTPHGLAGEDIPISGRILAIADTFDALTSRRPYKSPYPDRDCCQHHQGKKGHCILTRL
jgi:putative two-component system response regulator